MAERLPVRLRESGPADESALADGFDESKSEEGTSRNGSVNYVAGKPASLRQLRGAITKAMA